MNDTKSFKERLAEIQKIKAKKQQKSKIFSFIQQENKIVVTKLSNN